MPLRTNKADCNLNALSFIYAVSEIYTLVPVRRPNFYYSKPNSLNILIIFDISDLSAYSNIDSPSGLLALPLQV